MVSSVLKLAQLPQGPRMTTVPVHTRCLKRCRHLEQRCSSLGDSGSARGRLCACQSLSSWRRTSTLHSRPGVRSHSSKVNVPKPSRPSERGPQKGPANKSNTQSDHGRSRASPQTTGESITNLACWHSMTARRSLSTL